MNLEDAYYDTAWFPLVVDVIHHQCKNIKSSTWHPQIKCGFHCNSFSKGMKNMAIHMVFPTILRITSFVKAITYLEKQFDHIGKGLNSITKCFHYNSMVVNLWWCIMSNLSKNVLEQGFVKKLQRKKIKN